MRGEVIEYGVCPDCGYRMLPILEMSPCGHDADSEIHALEGEGVVYSWTRVSSEGADRLMVMADFLAGALRITAPFEGLGVSIGDRVRLAAGDDTPYRMMPAD